jgi:hypothetical protein
MSGRYSGAESPRFGAMLVLAAFDHVRRLGAGVRLDLSQVEAAMQF